MRALSTLVCHLSLAWSLPSIAHWHLDSEHSRIQFMSYKNIDVAEVHRFAKLSGEVTQAGMASVVIDLHSVDTKIDIRDQRMKEHLFKNHPKALIQTQIDPKLLERATHGETIKQSLDATLSLNGQKKQVKIEVLISQLSDKRIQVNSIKPIILNVHDWQLDSGIEALKKVAKLSSISISVPVSFSLFYFSS